MIPKMSSLKDKIQAKAEVAAAVAELAEEKVVEKIKPLKVKIKVGKVKKLKK